MIARAEWIPEADRPDEGEYVQVRKKDLDQLQVDVDQLERDTKSALEIHNEKMAELEDARIKLQVHSLCWWVALFFASILIVSL